MVLNIIKHNTCSVIQAGPQFISLKLTQSNLFFSLGFVIF
jgi:hypothetical protein